VTDRAGGSLAKIWTGAEFLDQLDILRAREAVSKKHTWNRLSAGGARDCGRRSGDIRRLERQTVHGDEVLRRRPWRELDVVDALAAGGRPEIEPILIHEEAGEVEELWTSPPKSP
jgi:hypothetical protein